MTTCELCGADNHKTTRPRDFNMDAQGVEVTATACFPCWWEWNQKASENTPKFNTLRERYPHARSVWAGRQWNRTAKATEDYLAGVASTPPTKRD
jgi:hypothetical protein